jgi:hypothetical protein
MERTLLSFAQIPKTYLKGGDGMPRGDGTGPSGQGPVGRGLGGRGRGGCGRTSGNGGPSRKGNRTGGGACQRGGGGRGKPMPARQAVRQPKPTGAMEADQNIKRG